MKIERIKINNIPSMVWGEKSNKVFIAIHGNMSNKEDEVVKTDFGQTLYWDYYQYVKENPITKWDKKTYILYGNKDNMQNEEIIEKFVIDFKCNLTILKNGEHYFHTEEQLNYYKEWLGKTII